MHAQPDSSKPTGSPVQGQLLSSVADGQANAEQLAHATRLWRDDAQARATWHTYHLIGDVLRSDELARDPARDVQFLSALRGRLALEPAVLAPVATSARRAAWRWPSATAVAAGFMVVAAGALLLRPGLPEPRSPALARAPGQVLPPPGVAVTVATGVQPVPAGQLGLTLLRDAQLDRYLHAHRAFGATAPVAQQVAGRRALETVSLGVLPSAPVTPAVPGQASGAQAAASGR